MIGLVLLEIQWGMWFLLYFRRRIIHNNSLYRVRVRVRLKKTNVVNVENGCMLMQAHEAGIMPASFLVAGKRGGCCRLTGATFIGV